MNERRKTSGRAFGPLPRFAVLAALALPLAACDTEALLEVNDPDIVVPEQIAGPEALPSVRAGVIGDFAETLENQVLYSGLLGDEWIHSGTFPTRQEVDRRDVERDNATVGGVYLELQRARQAAERGAKAFAEFGPDVRGRAEVEALAGYTFVFFGENFCSGVPFSEVNPDGSFTFGEPLPTEQVFERALEKFRAALAVESAPESEKNLARVGLARTLVDLGRFQEAAQVAQDVPEGFYYKVEYSSNTGRENNGVFVMNYLTKRWSAVNNEAGEGLNYITAEDPRVLIFSARRRGFDRRTPLFLQRHSADRGASIVLGDWVEARLIQAEAALQSNDLAGFTDLLNELRDNVSDIMPSRIENFASLVPNADLEPLPEPGTPEEAVQVLFRERAFWMYVTSHRLGDMRRLVRQYGVPSNQVFPEGEYFKGGFYGEDLALPVTVDEENNPNFQAEDCNTTIP